ncbi:hypothetical protein ET475_03985 [Microbacterium protaetiae]|uniref:Uncharacterized protein n=1 Tax=Microbacterium protaetiae TaxID=2509458 RepID=A0A4P6EB54_9MICO|nr:hypothetical protein [Microbacterium protaetiae]QAY59234.1 hypothetical protein ET475_03985 [Microbacterium protaetiae]
MTGKWEQRLRDIAVGGRDWKLPAAGQLTQTLTDLRSVLKKAAADPGVSGKTGLAASESLEDAAKRADSIVETTTALQKAVDKANGVRTQAGTDLSQLPSGTMSAALEAKVRAAKPGDVIDTGYACVLVNENTLANMQNYYAATRETAAKAAVQRATQDYDDIAVPKELLPATHGVDEHGYTPTGSGGSGGTSGGVPSGGFSTPGGSFTKYADWDDDPLGNATSSAGIFVPDDRPRPGDPGFSGYLPGGDDDVTVAPWTGGALTPDGPVSDGTTDFGSSGTSGGLLGNGSRGGGSFGSGSLGAGSYGSGSFGGGAGSGALIAGAGGATALTAGSRMAGGTAGMFGAGAGAGAGTGAGAGAGMGRAAGAVAPGGTAPAGAAGGLGGARGGGVAGSARSGGLLGGTRPTSAASAGAGAAAGGRGGSSMVGAGGGAGGRGAASNDSRRRARGLGGPIAESIEEDEEFGPRSAAAGSGGRGPATPPQPQP